ncbi:MAG: hypothetical protein L0211_00935 [Planctomycetaceae bacterium]|nr:hypothetical protein [Planctomycetaceae bacterium]
MSSLPNPPPEPAAQPLDPMLLVRGLGGAIVGGLIGYFLFRWLATQALGAHALPGAAIGIGAGWAARGRSQLLGVLCAVAAAILIIIAEWLRAPFVKDKSLLFFVSHLLEMDGATLKLVLMALGTACAYWFGQGR